MATPVLMPKQGQSVESCIITEWKKKKGDTVKKGDILYSYETDKASFEVEAEADGVLLDVFYNDGDEVPVLVNVAVIGTAGEDTNAFRAQGEAPKAPVQEKAVEVKSVDPNSKIIESSVESTEELVVGDVKISPRAKKLAEKLNVYYQNAKGSGPKGRIIERDIEALAASGSRMTVMAAKQTADGQLAAPMKGTGLDGRIRTEDLFKYSADVPAGADFEIKKISNMRKIIAENMLRSLHTSAQLTHHMSADARKMLSLREVIKTESAAGKLPNITINDMVCYAVVKALKQHPDVNGHFLGDAFRLYKSVHLGIAVDTPRGLMVPVLKNADDYNLAGVATRLKEIAIQCKEGKIAPELLNSEAGTFTISNLGAFGVEMFTPVLNIPQIAILGVCAIIHKPKDIGGGTIAFVPHIGLSLTYDHRALDGAPASAFMKTLVKEIENISL